MELKDLLTTDRAMHNNSTVVWIIPKPEFQKAAKFHWKKGCKWNRKFIKYFMAARHIKYLRLHGAEDTFTIEGKYE